MSATQAREHPQLDGFYNFGFTKVDDTGGVDDDVKNRALSILAGVSFSVGG